MQKLTLTALFICAAFVSTASTAADNVVLITLDGLRWQELFLGLDRELAQDKAYVTQEKRLWDEYWADDGAARAKKLMPFMHEVIFPQGSYAGDRTQNSCAKVSNDWYFSYPGYSEILTGVVNPSINSNSKIPNPELTFLELLDSVEGFAGTTAAFASWDVFPYIFNVQRSGIHVNAFAAETAPGSEFEAALSRLQNDMSPPWPTVRNDAFTHHFAMSYFKREKPKVLFISYGETDDYAHDGKYDEYIFAANRTDRFIKEIWQLVQSTEGYRDNTDLFITVDHGRGDIPKETWVHHASKTSVTGYMSSLSNYEEGIVGSEAVWMAALGPDVPAQGLIKTTTNCLTSNRIAATLLDYLGVDYRQTQPGMGSPMMEFIQ